MDCVWASSLTFLLCLFRAIARRGFSHIDSLVIGLVSRCLQALMELVLALKKALRHATPSPVSHTTLSSKDIMYVQGREGPQLCSLVNLARKVVLEDSTIRFGASCCVCLILSSRLFRSHFGRRVKFICL